MYETVQEAEEAATKSRKQIRLIQPYSEVYDERKFKKNYNKIIISRDENPLKQMTFKANTLKPTKVTEREGTKRRVGKPRVK